MYRKNRVFLIFYYVEYYEGTVLQPKLCYKKCVCTFKFILMYSV